MICSPRGRYRTTLLVLQLGFAVPSLSSRNFNIGTTAAHIPNESLDRIQATFLPDATQAVRQVWRSAPNAAFYYTMLVVFFLFESFKAEVSLEVTPEEAYATTLRRRIIDVAATIVRHAGKIILKVAAAAMEQLQYATL